MRCHVTMTSVEVFLVIDGNDNIHTKNIVDYLCYRALGREIFLFYLAFR